MHYKVKKKIVRLVKEKKYYQLGYYLFELVFRDKRVQSKRDMFIGKTPQKTEKLLERRFPSNTPEVVVLEECSTFIERNIMLIERGILEP